MNLYDISTKKFTVSCVAANMSDALRQFVAAHPQANAVKCCFVENLSKKKKKRSLSAQS